MKHVLIWTLLWLMTPVLAQEYSATYRLTFIGEWGPQSHPIDYPSGSAHFSNLIGNTHNHNGFIWRPLTLASEGIQYMAEEGSVIDLTNEINALIGAGHAEQRLIGPTINAQSTGDFEFTITESHPQVSLTTMIAPSPDWFLGVHGLNLLEQGEWNDQIIIDLLPYDAGTDGGLTFQSSNTPTLPPEPIERIDSEPLPDGVPMGVFVFTRLSSSGTPSYSIFAHSFEN